MGIEIHWNSVEDPTIRKVINKDNPLWKEILRVNKELDKKKKSKKPEKK